ncbi:hypothetical protein HNY73_023127 [Argiope bruennichi]|uniref:Uncharacterized protein n=1 Tax=Argiope bruennichi TaxID=94029 RepID=A0A8T0E7F3_ARGBR|nr:hypothetical protein HNY73_023127 [Argiope bruennichi]
MAQFSALYLVPKLTQACSGLAAMFLLGHLCFSTDYKKISDNREKSRQQRLTRQSLFNGKILFADKKCETF